MKGERKERRGFFFFFWGQKGNEIVTMNRRVWHVEYGGQRTKIRNDKRERVNDFEGNYIWKVVYTL